MRPGRSRRAESSLESHRGDDPGGRGIFLTAGLALALLAAPGQTPPAAAPDPARVDSLLAYVGEHAELPDSLILRAFESHRLVFLGDVHPAAEPKRLVARLVAELKERDRLDVLVLEVPFEQQPVIEAYLRSDPEDVGLLVGHPLTLRAHWGASLEYLGIYRAVWAVNRRGPPPSRIRIVAADAPRGPPQVASERDAVARFARRDAIMASRIVREVLERDPDAYVLIFMGGYHGLKDLGAEVEWHGARARLRWMAAQLRERWPEPVYTILTDGGPEPAPYLDGPSHGATRWFALLRSRLEGVLRAPFAVAVTPLFDLWPGALLEPVEGELSVRFVPEGYAVAGSLDAYLYLGLGDPITPLARAP